MPFSYENNDTSTERTVEELTDPMNFIESYVFLDFETTGLIKNVALPGLNEWKESNPGKTLEDLLRVIVGSVPKSIETMPHVTELSLRSISKKQFERGMDEMSNDNLGTISTNDLCLQFNLPFDETQWAEYNNKFQTVTSLKLTQEVLESKNYFPQEWDLIYNFLANVKKPAVVIAHNGIRYDYPLLFGELSRDNGGKESNMLEQFRSIEGLYFADTKDAFEVIETKFLNKMDEIIIGTGPNDETLEEVSNSSVNAYLKDVKSKALTERYSAYFNELSEDEYALPVQKLDKQRTSQATLFRTIIGRHYNDHHASADTEALMKICMAYGKDFVRYLDEKRDKFPF
uniref:Exonuclease domain-containing protein n=1 Tax=Rhabditophanes sp. KR3021 TaxID=114890 RepID=A0AC35TGH5_9BILA